MFFEIRTYRLQPQRLPDYFAAMEDKGSAMVAPIKQHMVAQFQTEVGPLNQIVSLYRFDSFEQRAAVRAEAVALSRTPEFADVPGRIKPLLLEMDSRIVLPTPLSPMR
jgi:hypothetical protein